MLENRNPQEHCLEPLNEAARPRAFLQSPEPCARIKRTGLGITSPKPTSSEIQNRKAL